MEFKAWIEKLAPDILETLRRFPFAVALQAIATAIFVAAIQGWIAANDEFWFRIAIGLSTGALFAIAGVLFSESRPADRAAGMVLSFAVPVAVVALFQVYDTHWFVPYALPLVGVLWLSVGGFTEIGRGEARQNAENRFWWLNHQAAATAVIALVGFLLISLGITAIERSVALLFGFDSGSVFYTFVLPVIGAFFTPLYWLSTIPRLAAYDDKALIEPDFISRAIGFLGQFILTPLLLAYALILLAYTAQIVLIQQIPQGILGWMVLGFTITGAATWLVLHPPFMRSRGLVRLFRRYWFWLTIIPLVLFAFAVYIRIDAYGFTFQRIVLMTGGLWAAALTLIYLTGRGDIRLIPVLAALALLLATVGPWNMVNGPKLNQAARLDSALEAAGVRNSASKVAWTPQLAAKAESALTFLAYNDAGETLAQVLTRHGVSFTSIQAVRNEIGIAKTETQGTIPASSQIFTVYRMSGTNVDVGATPILIGETAIWSTSQTSIAGLDFSILDNKLTVQRNHAMVAEIDLAPWASRQSAEKIVRPYLDFTADGIAHRLAISDATIQHDPSGIRSVLNLNTILFASKAVPSQ